MTTAKGKQSSKAVPYYEQVANVLRMNIADGGDRDPVRLSPERDLCEIHQVSRITIRKALELLEAEGLVQRTPGRGTLTVPAAIRQWKRLRQERVIHVLTNWENPLQVPSSYYGQIYQGIWNRAEQAGYRLAVQSQGHRTSIDRTTQMPEAATTLGVIFVGLMNEPLVRLYTQAGYTVVCVDYWTTDPQADAIVFDCYGEGQTAGEFLVRQGHHDLFYIGNLLQGGTAQKESDAELLLAGLQRGLESSGAGVIPPQRICFLNSDAARGSPGMRQRAREAMDWFLTITPRPTAGIVFSLGLLEEFIRLLGEAGLRCPEDVSLISKAWKGERMDATCLRGDAVALGQLATDCLLDRALGRRPFAVRLAVPTHLDRGRTVRQLA